MIEIRQLKVACGSDRPAIEKKIRKMLRLKPAAGIRWEIARHSIDARKKPDLFDVYTIYAHLDGEVSPSPDKGCEGAAAPDTREEQLVRRLNNKNIRVTEETVYTFPEIKPDLPRLRMRPVVIGSGPAGLFSALMLSEHGYRPILLERGKPVDERVRDVERFFETGDLDPSSNIQFGEGGAGTFSDGKLTTGVKDRSGRIGYVLRTFVNAGAPEDILFENLPHIGTDRLIQVVVSIRKDIIRKGGEVRFSSLVTDLIGKDGKLQAVRVREANGRSYTIDTDVAILAPGHSARDTIRMLYREGFPLQQKNFAVGFRVSHPQSLINRAQYGIWDDRSLKERKLTPASYKLTAKAGDGRGVYSFCMCPGGYVVNASSETGRLCVNGMSNLARESARANSAIVMTVGEDDYGSGHPLAGVVFQEGLESRAYHLADGRIPVERYADFKREYEESLPEKGQEDCSVSKTCEERLSGETGDGSICPLREEETKDLCIRGRSAYAPLHALLPRKMTRAFIEGMGHFDRTIPGFAGEEAFVMGLESRTSSPVRILRDDGCESAVKGLFPCGEGAGYAGGIMSAAVDGIRVAEAVARRFRPAK